MVTLKKYGTLRMTGDGRQVEESRRVLFERSEFASRRDAAVKTVPTRSQRPRDVAKQLASKGGDGSVAMCRAFWYFLSYKKYGIDARTYHIATKD